MENNVVSLDLAKRMKAAGFPQETERFWCQTYSISELGPAHEDYGNPDVPQHSFNIGEWRIAGDARRIMRPAVVRWYDSQVAEVEEGQIAAPTAQEIADALPRATFIQKCGRVNGYHATAPAQDTSAKRSVGEQTAATIANALGELWLKLQESEDNHE